MRPFAAIILLWRPRAGLLLAGLCLSLASLACLLALMAASGATIAFLPAGTSSAAMLLGVAVLLRVLGPARVLLRYLERMTTHNATFHALADLRVWFFRGLAGSAAGGLGYRRAGDMLSRIVGDVDALDSLYLRILLPLAATILLVPAAAIAAGRIDLRTGLIVATLLAVSAFLLPAMAARAAGRGGRQLALARASLRLSALDTLTGLREVRAYGAEAAMTARIAASGADLQAAQHVLARKIALADTGALICSQASLLVVLLAAGTAPLASIVAVFLLTAVAEPLSGLPRAGVAGATAQAAASRVLETVAEPSAVAEPTVALPIPAQASLRFAGVHFAWSPDQPAVFDGLTLEIPAGARVALLGPSGSGKSTMAALLLKTVLPQSGRVMLGGVDTAQLASADIHRQIAWLSQATHLFDDTIRANLLLGRPEAIDRELWDALDRAEIGETVRALPDQLDTWLGESGARLSGGQGRRIALARTLLTRAPVMILDEPCAGLDAETERAFLVTLFAQPVGQTMILIAHRLTGVEKLDRIWRLSGGHAVAAAA